MVSITRVITTVYSYTRLHIICEVHLKYDARIAHITK